MHKIALISYHKNANTIYQQRWIKEYRDSILSQTFNRFDIFELEYSGGDYRIFDKSFFESKSFPTFVHSLNYLLDNIFSKGYEAVWNTNVDDVYSDKLVEKMLPFIESGFDLVSCNFHLVNEGGIYHSHRFESLNIENELNKNHNIIAHPSCCYSANFWKLNRYVPDEIPFEDLRLWQRAIKNSKFIILPDHLLYHRIHDNSVCKSENR